MGRFHASSAAVTSPLCHEDAVNIELLDAVIAIINHKDVVACIYGQRKRTVKLAIIGSGAAPLKKKHPVGVAFLDTVAAVNDVNIADVIQSNTRRSVESAINCIIKPNIVGKSGWQMQRLERL
jgi:hypothetical protein